MTRGVGTAEPVPVIRQYLRVLLRWRYVIIGTVVACCVLGLIGTLLMTPKYTASTTIEISRESDWVTDFQGVNREASVADQEFQTQYGLLESRALSERVATQLGLVDDPNSSPCSAYRPRIRPFNRWAGGIRPADGQRANASRAKYY
jgi:uncharacterized protein involved in exopolysaccharide biosynthesis